MLVKNLIHCIYSMAPKKNNKRKEPEAPVPDGEPELIEILDLEQQAIGDGRQRAGVDTSGIRQSPSAGHRVVRQMEDHWQPSLVAYVLLDRDAETREYDGAAL